MIMIQNSYQIHATLPLKVSMQMVYAMKKLLLPVSAKFVTSSRHVSVTSGDSFILSTQTNCGVMSLDTTNPRPTSARKMKIMLDMIPRMCTKHVKKHINTVYSKHMYLRLQLKSIRPDKRFSPH